MYIRGYKYRNTCNSKINRHVTPSVAYGVEYYAAFNMNELELYGSIWAYLRNIILDYKKQVEKDMNRMIPCS